MVPIQYFIRTVHIMPIDIEYFTVLLVLQVFLITNSFLSRAELNCTDMELCIIMLILI